MLEKEANTIARLALLDVQKLLITEKSTEEQANQRGVGLVLGEVEIFIPMEELADILGEHKHLDAEIADVKAEIERKRKLLDNEQFVTKAKPEVVQRERDKLTQLLEEQAKLLESRNTSGRVIFRR
jgi:valyl-tRNA synthetase